MSATRRGRQGETEIDREVEAAQGRGYVVRAWRLDGGCGLCARRVAEGEFDCGDSEKREGIRTGEGNNASAINAMLNRRRRVGEARVLYCIYCRLCIVHVYCYCGIYM